MYRSRKTWKKFVFLSGWRLQTNASELVTISVSAFAFLLAGLAASLSVGTVAFFEGTAANLSINPGVMDRLVAANQLLWNMSNSWHCFNVHQLPSVLLCMVAQIQSVCCIDRLYYSVCMTEFLGGLSWPFLPLERFLFKTTPTLKDIWRLQKLMSYVFKFRLSWVPQRRIKQFIEAILDLGVLNQLSSPSRFHLKGWVIQSGPLLPVISRVINSHL